MSLLLRVNLWLLATFLCFLLAAVLAAREVLRDDARLDAIADARLLMEAAQAARDYTAAEIGPMISAAGATPQTRFFPQTVPAYAATQIFDALRRKRPEYAYREATLNPTNPRDRALAWEADVIEHFRNNPAATEFINDRAGELGRSLYLAQPIRIDDERCLLCHDTAATAPAPIVAQYGRVNGFGWKLREAVGAQIVSVPLNHALARADRVVAIVAGVLTGLFVLMFIVVNLLLRSIVLRPIAKLASAADSLSTGQKVDLDLNLAGRDEIASLCRAFDRMKTSVEKSLQLLAARD